MSFKRKSKVVPIDQSIEGDILDSHELEDLYLSQKHVESGSSEVAKKAAQIAARIRSGAIIDPNSNYEFDVETKRVRLIKRRKAAHA